MPLEFESFSINNSSDDELKSYLSKNFEPIHDISHIRNSNFYVFELNGKYILRIRRPHKNLYLDKSKLYNGLIKLNAQFEHEMCVVNNIYHSVHSNWTHGETTPLPKYIYSGVYKSHKIGIYKKLIGTILTNRDYHIHVKNHNYNPCNYGKQIGLLLSIIHSLDAVKVGMVSSDRIGKKKPVIAVRLAEQSRYIENNICEIYKFSKDIDFVLKLIQKLSNFFSYKYQNKRLIATHNAIEQGHLLLNQFGLSGLIDWEHFKPSTDSIHDISDFYSNFVAEPSDHSKSKSVLYGEFLWESFCSSYFSSSENIFLTSDIINIIEELSILKLYYQSCVRIVDSHIPSTRIRKEVDKMEFLVSVYLNRFGNK